MAGGKVRPQHEGVRKSRVLANREFRALWLAEAQSVAGDQLAKVAVALLVYARTQSAPWTAGAYALTYLPELVGGLLLSPVADRYPRRAVLVTSTLVQAACIGAMAVPGMPLAAMLVLLAGATAAHSPAVSAQNAVNREVFDAPEDEEGFYRSQDLRGTTKNVMMLLGLAFGGVLVGLLGASTALLIDALTFAAAAVLIRVGVRARAAAGHAGVRWSAGMRYVARTPWLRTVLALTWLVGFAVVPEGLAAPLAAELEVSDAAVGWLLAADPLGFVAGVFVLSRLFGTRARQRLLGVLAVAASGVLVVFLVQPALWLALLLLALAGLLGSYQVTAAATVTSYTPNEVRGGVIGVAQTGLRVAQGIGVAAGGAVADLLGSASAAIGVAALAGAVLAVPVTVAWARNLAAIHG